MVEHLMVNTPMTTPLVGTYIAVNQATVTCLHSPGDEHRLTTVTVGMLMTPDQAFDVFNALCDLIKHQHEHYA